MVKKIISILAFGIVFGALIWGGINYTQAKLGFETIENNESTELIIPSEEWIKKKVIVGNVESDIWSLLLEDGSELILEGRSLTYAIQNKFIPSEGDTLLLTGFEDELGTFEIAQIDNLDNGASLLLRNAYGQPLWGRGAGSGNGGDGK